MTMQLKLPELGENIESGKVTQVLVTVGDHVTRDQPLLEVESGKATLEIPAEQDGTVKSLAVEVGSEVTVGQVLLEIETGAPPAAAPPKEEPPPAAPTPDAKPDRPETPPKKAPEPEPARAAPETPPAHDGKVVVPAAPSVRRFARELGVDINQVTGSGSHGRVSQDDVKRHVKSRNQTAPDRPGSGPIGFTPPPLPDFSKWGAVEREPLTTIRQKTAEHMARCWAMIPHVTQFDTADITELDALRRKFAPKAEKMGGKLTMTAMLLKITAAALKVFPKFNASLDVAEQRLILKKYIHLGLAVDSERGLLVPVIRDADQKNMLQLAVEISALAAQVRMGKLAPETLEGGTFTVTNLGGIGGSFFTPIVNWPQVAILGVGRAAQTPALPADTGATRLTLPLSLSYDHRVIDGADGARFLRWIVEAIEEPLLLSLEG
ncbi:MAG: 2-oxo acid dehydrogenase subunit E2 [Candidatus Marinimicrobia bacterium]|nr:2-oxo acid dehydrogenase subunit E2 [Candidatus Neomarinimicrobiota bacterium]